MQAGMKQRLSPIASTSINKQTNKQVNQGTRQNTQNRSRELRTGTMRQQTLRTHKDWTKTQGLNTSEHKLNKITRAPGRRLECWKLWECFYSVDMIWPSHRNKGFSTFLKSVPWVFLLIYKITRGCG